MSGNAALASIERGTTPRARADAGTDLSELKQVEYARDQFQSMVESAPDAIVAKTLDGVITFWNKGAEALYGYPAADMVGRTSEILLPPDRKLEVADCIRRLRAGERLDPFRSVRLTSTGKQIAVVVTISPVTGRAGELVGIFTVTRDVTEAEHAHEQVAQAAAYARSLIEVSLDPLVTISPDGKITDVNAATIKVTGVPRDQLIGTDFSNYFTEPEKAREGYQQVFANGFVTDYPLTIRHKEGRLVDVLYNASVYRDASGKTLGVFAAARDVTETAHAHEQVAQAAAYARSLIEASLDPLVTISPEGKITDVNEATIKVTGVPRDELIGTDFSDYFTESQKAREGYQRVFAKGFVTDYPLTIRHRQGRVTQVLYNASVYKDARERVLGIFAAARDVTELMRRDAEVHEYQEHLEAMVKERTADLGAANVKLETANQELESFAYSVSHDLRAPLRAVDGFSRMLLEDYGGKLDSEGQRLLNVVRDSTVTMSRMIDDILAFSRAGRAEMKRGVVNMDELVRIAISQLEPATAGRKVRFEVGSLAQAHGDGPMLQLVWTNLLDNAIKYTQRTPEAQIEIGSSAGNDEIVYYVRDNGIGFDMQYVGKLFGVFQRLHGTEFPGTGIGLAIVKRIVSRHRGRVWAEGTPGQGATFYFTLGAATDHD